MFKKTNKNITSKKFNSTQNLNREGSGVHELNSWVQTYKNFLLHFTICHKKKLGSDLACLTVYDISSDISCKYMYYVLNNSERGDAISSLWQ